MKLKLSTDSKFRFAVRSALFAGLAAGAQGAVYAQEATPQAAPDAAPAKEKPKSALEVAQATPGAAPAQTAPETTELGVVQVTGSRIPQPKLASSNSIVTVDSQTVKLSGYVDTEDLLNSLPQVTAEFTSVDNTGSQADQNVGIATVNLRNLGSARNLVLIDGKRVQPGNPTPTVGFKLSTAGADINLIPTALIDSVDVLSGGASAVYGSDALSGAVNFKIKRDFEGFRFDGNDRFTTTHGDAHQYNANFVYGTNFAGGSGNATVYAGFTKLEALKLGQRGFSEFDLGANGAGNAFRRVGSSAIPGARVISYDRLYAGLADYDFMVDPSADPNSATFIYTVRASGGPLTGGGTRSLVARDDRRFNFNPLNFFQRPTRRYVLGGFAHREFNQHLDLYGDAMFMDNRSLAQLGPDATFFQPFQINCDNPLLSQQQQDLLCNEPGLNSDPSKGPVDNAKVIFAKRLTEPFFGTRQSDLRNTDYRIVLGGKGKIPFAEDWATYDLSAQRGEVIFRAVDLNGDSFARIQQAFQVQTTDADGDGQPDAPVDTNGDGVPDNIACKSDLGGINNAGCVPLDLFQADKFTKEQADFIRNDALVAGNVAEQVVNANLTADLTSLGVKTPFTSFGPALNLGYEYRTEAQSIVPDATLQARDDPGFDGAEPKVSGNFFVHGGFVELRIPLADDQFLAKRLAINGAYRVDNFSNAAKEVHAWNGGVNYAPIEDVSVRGNLARAVRAPSVTELFLPTKVGVFSANDPCSRDQLDKNGDGQIDAGAPTLEQCERTGVTADQYNNLRITDCPAAQCNAKLGGNPDLFAERSITREIGLVLTPTVLRGFSATFDYWNISINQPIASLPPATVLTQCLTTGLPDLCNLIQRGPTGILFGNDTNFIQATNINIGAIRTRGYDVGLDYRFQFSDLPLGLADTLGDWGGLAFAFNGTITNSLRVDTGALSNGGAAFDCAGLFGATCGTPTPHWRHVFRTTWRAPLGLDLSANWRRIGRTFADVNSDNPNLKDPSGTKISDDIGGKIKKRQYLDLTAHYAPQFAMLQGLAMQLGITNVLNRRPPVISSDSPSIAQHGNTFPSFFDFAGPMFFAGLTYDLK